MLELEINYSREIYLLLKEISVYFTNYFFVKRMCRKELHNV